MNTLAAADLADAPFHPQVWGGRTVPYITRWSGETDVTLPDLMLRPNGLGYVQEFTEDRDRYRGLWERMAGCYGDGEPRWRMISSERQRTAMEHLLCQVCTRPASRTSKGVLFLEQGRVRATADLEENRTGQPPLCLPCAQQAREQCPRLTRHCIALRARKVPLWGVYGTVYAPRHRGMPPPTRALTFSHEEYVQYGTKWVPYVVAGQLLRTLRRVVQVDLDEELRGR